jgi:uncharacterized membrane-anchored protein
MKLTPPMKVGKAPVAEWELRAALELYMEGVPWDQALAIVQKREGWRRKIKPG